MPPKGVTLAAFLPSQFKPPELPAESTPPTYGPVRPPRCRCEGPYDLCYKYPNPAIVPNAACKATWDRILAPFQFKGREWTITELRMLWPLTIQALNERLQKGRMERTLKEDLQDDLQVLIDLIQHSCKPHPRPPRAGMKTLIVQGRILAEAIAQDALFQLDPSDPSAPRPDRDLVDLINRLREHHPASLLGPALHVLRSLGNTAVHLDRDSARLTDAEIGDAAAVVCRFVVLVVDAYMQMCANLHRHEEREEALAQPLEEAPVASIPPPNILLRPREAPAAAEEPAAPTALTPAASAPPARPPRLSPTSMRTHSASYTGFGGGVGGSGVIGGGVSIAMSASRGSSDGGGNERMASGGRRQSGGGSSGGRRSHSGGSADEAGRVPYSLVPTDWNLAAAQPQVPTAVAAAGSSVGGGPDGNSGVGSPTSHVSSRGWWPPASAVEAAAPSAVPAPPPLPLSLLRKPPSAHSDPVAPLAAEPLDVPRIAQPASQQASQASSLTNWLEGHPAPYGLPTVGASIASGLPNGAAASSDGGTAATAAPLAFGRAAVPYQPLHHAASDPAVSAPTAPYVLPSAAFTAAGLPLQHAATASPWPPSDPWDRAAASGSSAIPAGGSPRRSPISLVPGVGYGATGAAGAVNGGSGDFAGAVAAAAGVAPRGTSPQPLHPPLTHAAGAGTTASALQPPSQQQLPQPRHLLQAGLTGSGGAAAPAGAAGAAGLGAHEASKRLLQLCAVAQAPPAAKVQQLLQAGANLAVVDKSGMTALHMACYWCHTEAARLLLGRHPAAATTADREGRSPLWVASQRGHVELVQLLLQALGGSGGGGAQHAGAGAAVNAANTSNVTPLRVAAAQGHADVVAALLQAGASVDVADKDGFTPLYVACARSHLEVVRLLLAAGAPPDRPDKAARTPLWAALHPGGAAKADACPDRRAAVVRGLLAAGADVHLLGDVRDRDYCWQLLAQSIAAGE